MTIELRDITEDNYRECLELNAGVINKDFVDTVAWSLAEAWVFYNDSKPFAIYADNKIVGYVLLYVGENNPQIINFMIDERYQKNGYGKSAATLCINYLKKEFGATRISLPVEPENIAAQKLWTSVGFEMTNVLEEGYYFMRLQLT